MITTLTEARRRARVLATAIAEHRAASYPSTGAVPDGPDRALYDTLTWWETIESQEGR